MTLYHLMHLVALLAESFAVAVVVVLFGIGAVVATCDLARHLRCDLIIDPRHGQARRALGELVTPSAGSRLGEVTGVGSHAPEGAGRTAGSTLGQNDRLLPVRTEDSRDNHTYR